MDSFTLLDRAEGMGDGAWVVHDDAVSCSQFLAGELAYFFAEEACCDVLPPGDPACLLGIDDATLLSPALVADLVTGG